MNKINTTFIGRRGKHNFLLLFLSFAFVIATGVGCDAPAGAEGPEGPKGEQGPIGPAGEDGSKMYAGEGEPAEDIADIGDYYLNQNTGELYGPKNNDGWGSPIIVLMGDAGQDGEDGSQIHSGTGTPAASLGKVGDYYLNKSNYDLYGPKTNSGWGTPINIKGAKGNANVTRYIFSGNDFSANGNETIAFPQITEEKVMKESSFQVYLVTITASYERYNHIPGYGMADDVFSVYRNIGLFNHMTINILLKEGTGRMYDRIEVIHIKASDTNDHRKINNSLIPEDLDISDYEAVAEYYGF